MGEDLREYIQDSLTFLEMLHIRIYKDDITRERAPLSRDYARVLYSSSFRRLQGKMQLLGLQDDKFFRNRLTHSLEVSQIARSIAEKIEYGDTFAVEAAALAHDIGNPPFGHYGERVLNNLCKDIGGFEGNAQTLRVLMNLEKKNPDSKGLNLTVRTLLSVVKYFNKAKAGQGKFLYDEDYNSLNKYIEENKIIVRTTDVQIVDLADEIAYAAHDLEDALSMKLFTIDELLFEFQLMSTSKNIKAFDFLKEKIIDEAKKIAGKANIYHSSEEYAFLLRKNITSKIVNYLIRDIGLIRVEDEFRKKTGTMQNFELGFKQLGALASGLKNITFKCINRSPSVQLYEKQGDRVIKGLFEVFTDNKFNCNCNLMPAEFRTVEGEIDKRLVIDYIAGMMDSYAIATYEKYFGKAALDKIYGKKSDWE